MQKKKKSQNFKEPEEFVEGRVASTVISSPYINSQLETSFFYDKIIVLSTKKNCLSPSEQEWFLNHTTKLDRRLLAKEQYSKEHLRVDATQHNEY